jgi:5-deoxy-glucuronate isomerase
VSAAARDNASWVLPAGTSGSVGWEVEVTDAREGWQHTGLQVATLSGDDSRTLDTGEREVIVVPLSGSVAVRVDDAAGGHEIVLAGRESVFAGATDVAYVGRDSRLELAAAGGGQARVALALARVTPGSAPKPLRHLPVADVPIELRGAGVASREVRNFGVPAVLDADSIIACEVITPAGNWSSYPPHKHDEERPGEETALEEIYYFELQTQRGGPSDDAGRPGGNGGDHSAGTTGGGAPRAVAYHRVYGTADRPIDVLAEVRSGDVVLVPHGWHGPSMAPPGYDLYYLNVMAGPGDERAWLICDDRAHGWVRDAWTAQQVDPRLPFGRTR